MNRVLVVTLVRLGFSRTACIPPRLFMYLSLQQCHPCTFCSSSSVFLLVPRALPCSPSTPELPSNSLRNSGVDFVTDMYWQEFGDVGEGARTGNGAANGGWLILKFKGDVMLLWLCFMQRASKLYSYYQRQYNQLLRRVLYYVSVSFRSLFSTKTSFWSS